MDQPRDPAPPRRPRRYHARHLMPTSGRNRLLSVSVIGTAVAVATTMTVTSSMGPDVKGMSDNESQVVGPTSDVPSEEPQSEPRQNPGSGGADSKDESGGKSTHSSPPSSESSPEGSQPEESGPAPDDDSGDDPGSDSGSDDPKPLPDKPECKDNAVSVSDAFARDGEHSAKNFGDSQLEVQHADEGLNRMAFVKFDVSKLCDDFTTATMNVTGYVVDEAIDTSDIGVHSAPSNWDEYGITWENKPALDSQLGSFTVAKSDPLEYSIDVTQYLESAEGDEVTIALYAPDGAQNEAVAFHDRTAEQPPTLNVS